MPFLTDGLPGIGVPTGLESFAADTNAASGANPQQVKVDLYQLSLMLTTWLNSLSKTMVDGTIYYSEVELGAVYDPTPQGSNISEQSYTATGMNVPVGSTGGTDTWHVGVYNSAGVLVARSATAGVTAGTALTIQQIPFYGSDGATLAPVTLTSGTYYLALQGNGTTAKFLDINAPDWPKATGSQAGTAGTLAAITSIATTYTADLGPRLSLYA